MGRAWDTEASVGQEPWLSSSPGKRELADRERHERERGMLQGKEERENVPKNTDKYKFICLIFRNGISWESAAQSFQPAVGQIILLLL